MALTFFAERNIVNIDENSGQILAFHKLPKSGTASDVAGIVSATIFKNTVNDSNIVTPAIFLINPNKFN